MEVVNNLLSVEDADIVKDIILSSHAKHDQHLWAYTKDAKYTVKSGYWLDSHRVFEEDMIEAPAGNVDLKNEVWKLKVLPKIKHFLWRVLSGVIPTAERLRSRTLNINPTCQRCCVAEETINHVLFECQHAKAIWRCLHVLNFDRASMDLEENFKVLFQISNSALNNEEVRIIPFWTCWIIWKSRNKFLFNHRNVHPNEDAVLVKNEIQEWIDNLQKTERVVCDVARDLYPTNQFWESPPIGWLKCNFDGSFRSESEFTGVGWIIRDHTSAHICSGNAGLRKVNSPLQAEAMGFLNALQIVWIKGWREVWFETDCLELTRMINQQEESIEIGTLLIDIRYWMSKLPRCSLGHVNRERNRAADILSKRFYEDHVVFSNYVCPPVWLINSLYYPYTS